MAEGPDPVVADLEQEVTCGICHDRYQEPKLLPCCHYYCKQCILTLSSRYRPNQPFPCPDCREPTLLPDNNPDRLPTAFFINRMKALHSRMEKAHGKLETTCEVCSGGKATAFCRQCVNFICEKCVESHQRMKAGFATHIVSTLDELKQGGVKELTFENPPPPKCEDHEEPKKIFCFDCNKLICRDCIVIEHAGHNYEFVKKAAPATRKKLTEHLSPLKNLLPDLSTAVNQVKGTKQKIQAQKELTERQVNAKFQELHDILDRCKVRVLRESSALADSRMEKLTVQEKGLDLSLGTAQSLIDFVDRTLENASDEELITMQEQVVSRIDAEVVKRGKEAANPDPVEKDDFGVEIFVCEDLKNLLCVKNVFVYDGKVDPTKCTVEGDGAKNAEIDNPACFSINTHQPRKCSSKTKVTLKSLVDESSQQLQAVPVKGEVYSVEYTPRLRGRHHLLISVDDQPIPGSPFSVFIKIPPTKLDKPVRVMRGINNPRYMVFNSSEELIVTDGSGDVLVFDKKGKQIRSISKSKHGFGNICGVAVDKEDNIYVCDSNKHCVYKFNKRGDLLKRFGTKGNGPKELIWPRGIAVAGDQVFVCDDQNHRVQVLTTELEPVKQIGSEGTGNEHFNCPEDVTVDNEQMVYVTDCYNHRVQVLTMDGRFIRSIGKKGNGQGDLYGPHGVCVTGFVYVAEYTNKRVSAFTKDGQFVISFGNGHITNPYGVAVDSNGFVYVRSQESVVIF
ncbi:E3 ubiquitin-protein ligase TRIM71-like [Halichondria panicea]|uniref:E3 ubiquitin-protein ligase TRIM71-like n=1 Tax=Halichondria panicea TaxID=6063 RepID=UPI00312B6DA9